MRGLSLAPSLVTITMMSVLVTARPFLEVASAAALQLMPPHLTPGDLSFNTTDPSWGNPLVLPEEECDRLKIGVIYHSNFSTNTTAVTCLEHAPILTSSSVIRAVVLAVMAVLSLGGNLATIWSIRRGGRSSGRKHTCHGGAVYALILHLSVADLLVTVFCIAGEAAWSYTVEWLAGDAACKLFKFMQMFSLYLSTFVLVLIGVDRFVVVRYPMKSFSTSRRLNRAIAFVWVLSFLLSIPQLMIFRVATGPFYEEFQQCVTYGFYTEPWQEQLYTTFSLVCMFVMPLIILVSTYVCTVITIARSEKMFRAEVAAGGKAVASEVNRRRLIHRAKMKSFRISVVIVVTFIVWWTPYYTMMVIFMFLNPDKHKSEDLQSAIFFFGMSNSLVNPLIYGAFHLWKPKAARKGSTMYCYSREGSVVHQRSMMTNISNASSRSGSSKLLLTRPSVESHMAMPVHEEEKLLVQPLHKATTGS